MKHKQQRLLTQPPASLLTKTDRESDQNVTELKSSKRGSSGYGSNLKVGTQLPNDSASLHTGNKLKSKQANKKPSESSSGAATHHKGLRKTRSSSRNAVAAATTNKDYYQTTTTTMNENSSSTTSGHGEGVISAASAGCGDIRGEGYSLSTQPVVARASGGQMKGVSLPLSDHGVFGDSDPTSPDREETTGNDNRIPVFCAGEQQQEQRQALQPIAGAGRTVDVDLDDKECCTTLCSTSVYRESQIMGLNVHVALRGNDDQTQGNVESGSCPLPGLSEHSHGHNINTAINTESSNAADSALSGVISSSGTASLGNPMTDSTNPTQSGGDSASGSCPLQSREPAMCVHNNSHESTAEVMSSHDTDFESSVSGRKLRGRGRGRGRKRGRGQGKKTKDANESWIRTNSQPQTCDPVGRDLLEFSQTEQISSSLPERTSAQEGGSDMIWEESLLPNMAVVSKESISGGREESRPDLGTRTSFRRRGRRGVHGGRRGQRGRGTMATGTICRRIVTRSRTAALLKCKMEETEEPENANLPSSLSPPPPAKKQKQKPRCEDSPGATCRVSKETDGSGDNRVTIMDISASSPANAVCGVNDGVALNNAGAANSVCREPRDSTTASPLFSTAGVNLDDGGSKHTSTLQISPSSCDEQILSETPSSLQSLATVTAGMCTTTATTPVADIGSTGAAEGDICTNVALSSSSSSSGKPCKSSSPSPPFSQCSLSVATTSVAASRPQAQQPSMKLVCCVCLCWGLYGQATVVCLWTSVPFQAATKGKVLFLVSLGYQGWGVIPPYSLYTLLTNTHTHKLWLMWCN